MVLAEVSGSRQARWRGEGGLVCGFEEGVVGWGYCRRKMLKMGRERVEEQGECVLRGCGKTQIGGRLCRVIELKQAACVFALRITNVKVEKLFGGKNLYCN